MDLETGLTAFQIPQRGCKVFVTKQKVFCGIDAGLIGIDTNMELYDGRNPRSASYLSYSDIAAERFPTEFLCWEKNVSWIDLGHPSTTKGPAEGRKGDAGQSKRGRW